MIDLKNEKGGIIIYVLVAMIILIATLGALYASATNKQVSQLEVAEQIKAVYEKDLNNVDNIYNNLVLGN